MRILVKIIIFACFGLLFGLKAEEKQASVAHMERAQILEFSKEHCFRCHGNKKAKAKLNLEEMLAGKHPFDDAVHWREAIERVNLMEMPPEDEPMPPMVDRERYLAGIGHQLRLAAERLAGDPGPFRTRRLNRTQYRYTMRDLLGIHVDVSHMLPPDGSGGEGFDNAEETLFISPLHGEMYLEAARESLMYSSKEAESRKRIFITKPGDKVTEEQAATEIYRNFMERAFRRPLRDKEEVPYVGFFKQARKSGDTFQEAIYYGLRGVLVSPHFLFRMEAPNLGKEPVNVTDWELAARLSYFLWASVPDRELRDLASKGKLSDPAVLKKQVIRMLKHRNRYEVAEDFMGQWLGTRELGEEFKPDTDLFKGYNERLESVMRSEPAYYLSGMLNENRSVLELIDSSYTYGNNDLLRHYKISTKGQKVSGSLNRFNLPEDSSRGGVLTMGAVLAVSSYPHRTSPVLRGKWLMEKILGTPPPPPPPNVPELEETPHGQEAKTLRERLEMHRANPNCASCHDRIDPIGFGLENFDAVGRWRDKEGGKPVDAKGSLPGGLEYEGVVGLKKALLSKPDKFVRHFTMQMFAFAMGRGIVESDHPVIDEIAKRTKDNEYKIRELIIGIVESRPFRMKRPVSAEVNLSAN